MRNEEVKRLIVITDPSAASCRLPMAGSSVRRMVSGGQLAGCWGDDETGGGVEKKRAASDTDKDPTDIFTAVV